MRTGLKTSIAFLLLLLTGVSGLYANPTKDQSEAFSEANIVIHGELADIQTNWVSGGYKLVFHVEESWIRPTEEYTTVNLAKGEECIEDFVKGRDYLVYVVKKFNLKVFCEGRYGESSEAWVKDDLPKLGKSVPPSRSPGAKYLPAIMTLLTIGGLALVIVVVLRKGKKS